jgi:hypothetical protein
MLCLVTFWLSLAGWVSLYEHSESVPWFVFGVVWVGALGIVGWAENHRVPIDDNGVTLSPAVALAIVALLALLLLSIISIVLLEAKRQEPLRRVFVWSGAVVLLLGLVLTVCWPNAFEQRTSIDRQQNGRPLSGVSAKSHFGL